MHRLRYLLRPRLQTRARQRPHLGVVERAQLPYGRGLTALGGAYEVQGGARLRAQGAQEQDGEIGEVVDDVLDDRDGLRVAVVQILQQDRAARLPAQHGQQPQQRLRQLHDRLRVSGRPGPAPLRDQPGQRRMVGSELRIGRGAGRPEPGRQRLGERAERHDEPGRGGPAAQHRHAEPVGPIGALAHQPGLSDTGFPGEEQRAPRTPLHGVQGAAQQSDLLVPPDDDRRSGSHGRRLLE
ncbi:hypothetical protein P376_4280 [Streptomyces sp. HCCB10043]|nr:hypothetical protein P376_4280 [Streptomyces sp. HCCB10043]